MSKYFINVFHVYKVDTWAGAQAECDSLGGFLVEAKLVILRISFLSNFSIIVYFVEVKYNSGLYHCHKKLCILLPQDGGGSPDTFPACDGSINKSFFPHLIVIFILSSVYLFFSLISTLFIGCVYSALCRLLVVGTH